MCSWNHIDPLLRSSRTAKMPAAEHTPQTLYDKVLEAHIVDEKLDGTILLYIGLCAPRPGPRALVARGC